MAKRITRKKLQLWAEKFGEKLFDLGNIVAGTMVFGQFITEKPFNWELVKIGLTLTAFLYIIGTVLILLK